ncbi:MAG: sigma-54-dependent Fis family transcriptional regulator [Deltaproteobacteria bacterium]|nr:sigma-54-dependent Fis family transcriptional regulator [Deltaproteobacteria bacterium]
MLDGYRVLVVDDRDDHGYACSLMVRSLGADVEVVGSALAALEACDSAPPDIALLDYMMPEMDGLELLREIKRRDRDVEVVMMTAFGTIPSAIEAVRTGAFDYLAKPFGAADLERVLRNLLEQRGKSLESHRLLRSTRSTGRFGALVGSSPAMLEILDVIRRAGPSESTILIQGESGTGKELIARAIHDVSRRQGKRFVTVDCGSIHPNLIQSELFGHVRGAFTGATQSTEGLIRWANGGTVFLDEVGELPLDTQTQLLRAIQEKAIRPVGSTSYHEVDVRFLAATNRDLDQAVRNGTFRQDLFYRLHVVQIRVPPLRERALDVAMLVDHFLAQHRRDGATLRAAPAALERLMRYPPGRGTFGSSRT